MMQHLRAQGKKENAEKIVIKIFESFTHAVLFFCVHCKLKHLRYARADLKCWVSTTVYRNTTSYSSNIKKLLSNMSFHFRSNLLAQTFSRRV